MINITHKSNTFRKAIAQAVVRVSSQATVDAIVNKQVPKGDVFEMAKTAGLFAVKRTSDMIPDCHRLPVEFTSVTYNVNVLEITILIEVHTVYKTGVEVEAMHGASVVALTMYDMLKPIDKGIEICSIKLIEKKGGKSDIAKDLSRSLNAAVIVCSDSVAAGKKEDKSGKAIMERLKKLNIAIAEYIVIADDAEQITQKINACSANKTDMLIFTGGTGLSSRDITPDVVKPLLDREIPGVMEIARKYGQDRMPYAMLSRGIAGMKGEMLILTLPGSVRGAEETMEALFPYILHVFPMIEGKQH